MVLNILIGRNKVSIVQVKLAGLLRSSSVVKGVT